MNKKASTAALCHIRDWPRLHSQRLPRYPASGRSQFHGMSEQLAFFVKISILFP